MNRRFVRIVAIVLAFIMLFSIGWIVLDAITGVSASARVTQAEINRLREEMREYQRRRREIQAVINAIDFERRTETAKKSVLDDRIMLTGMEIDNLVETIEQYLLLIEDKEVEVITAQAREDEQYRLYRTRVRDMEENGVITYLEIIFDSTSFSDLLGRIDFVSDIMRADEQIYYRLVNARLETIAAKEALEATVLEMEEEQVLLEEKREELYEQLEEANAIILQLQQDRETEAALYNEVAADQVRVQRQIAAREQELRRQEERDRLAAIPRVRGTGELMWPVPSSRNVTSGFGTRMHPVFRVMRQHLGIDIAAGHGTNVVAADSGTVITSDFNSSYGNYIVISHGYNDRGERITTLYAHLSSRSVRRNDTVEKGQVIGRIGSTGISTGPHLHFEVTVNGTRVNPLNRL